MTQKFMLNEAADVFAEKVCMCSHWFRCRDLPFFAMNSALVTLEGGVQFRPQGIAELWKAILAELGTHPGMVLQIRCLYIIGSITWWVVVQK